MIHNYESNCILEVDEAENLNLLAATKMTNEEFTTHNTK